MRPTHAAVAAVPDPPAGPAPEELVESYRRLAEVFHDVLSEQSLDSLLVRVADTLSDLVPYDGLAVYEADEQRRLLTPVLARDRWADEIMGSASSYGEGITGWAAERREPVLTNRAHLDARAQSIPGTPTNEPEALITVPLVARGQLKGALNIYRIGETAGFTAVDFELARSFADAAALALDNAHVRARLEREAQTDSLTGLFNHRYFHERLRAELTRASRRRDSVSVLMLDIDDFKRVNDVHGHSTGDQVLCELADLLRRTVRGSDVVCRLGGEEFGVIMSACETRAAWGLGLRLTERLRDTDFGAAGRITVSTGIAQGPDHAANPRELVACAEVAMMTAKARGKNRIVLFGDEETERPETIRTVDDARSIAHLKMLQSLCNKLNRLTDVRAIGRTIADELRSLIDYHNCRISIVDGDDVIPIAFRGHLDSTADLAMEFPTTKVGEGVTGHVAATGEALLLPDAKRCEFAVLIPGTHEIEESMIAVPLRTGARVTGTIVITKLGVGQFDDDDVRLLEVLAGHASVAVENARLYEAQRHEVEQLEAQLAAERARSEDLERTLRSRLDAS